MRIAIVSETWSPEINGVALTVANLVQGLRAIGHSVQIIRPRQRCDGHAKATDDMLLVRGLRVPRYPEMQFGLPAPLRLRAAWKRQRPDIVYVATEGPLGFSALRAARALNIPVSTGFHTRFDDFARFYGVGLLAPIVFSYLRYFHRCAAATFVPTTQLRDFLLENNFGNVVVLPRAVDTAQFAPSRRDDELRRQWGLRPDQLAVIYVGRLAPEKNFALAVRAFAQIRKLKPDARYIFVGEGPARAALEREHADFIFTGVQRGIELARHFASGDLFLFPSLTETFGNVTLEALASGVPTVAFDYGAAREYLGDDSGMRVAFGDEDAFVRAAVDIARDDLKRARMSTAARAAVAELNPLAVSLRVGELLAECAQPRPVAPIRVERNAGTVG